MTKRKQENPDDASWQDFKLILGNEIYLCRDGLTSENFIKGEDRFYHFILLALDDIGHKQIRELSTRAFKHSWFRNMRRVPTYYSDLEEVIGANPGHVWGSTACLGGVIPQMILAKDAISAVDMAEYLNNIFKGNFSFEMQPSYTEEQIEVNTKLIQLSNQLNIPLIITTDAHYLSESDRKIHKSFLNSRDAERETDSFYASTYFMNAEQIHGYMDASIGARAVDEALDFTNIIADKIKPYSLLKSVELPYVPLKILEEPTHNGWDKEALPYLTKFYYSEEESDRQLAYSIINFIIEKDIEENPDNTEIYAIENGLEALWKSSEVNNVRWSRYLLSVHDYVDICWEDGDTIVGAGRGSGVGFYINYILGITQIDPTKEIAPMHGWRFINPDRASILDIDIDIQSNRRNKCIKALKKQYGEFRVVEVATFGTEKARSAIKTACRGLGVDVDIANYISSFVESDRGIQRDLAQTFYGDEENGLKPNTQFRGLMTNDYPHVWEMAQKIEGIITRVGKHAGGVVIVDEEFTERAAIMTTNKDEYVSQYELHDLEDLGQRVNRPNKILNCLSAA